MGFCILIDKCSSLNAGALLDSSTVLTVEKSGAQCHFINMMAVGSETC